ncbi:MAG: His/Gly/Thr/Pro-type tRNA ligase C-terminal domain-containing protein [Lentisphaeria bacterium]|jgi:threonyl-tRNA synthetase|nr:His/Gly/Thr/Pro-type tRNA ligase C-terminal domain-containing protein [Lentisphaeria bacterium]MDP7741648.1 His/Gly/Thr/Pro-type tRNA ligase C-terminal domain-containing protein [Lentisphaeria bacterium]
MTQQCQSNFDPALAAAIAAALPDSVIVRAGVATTVPYFDVAGRRRLLPVHVRQIQDRLEHLTILTVADARHGTDYVQRLYVAPAAAATPEAVRAALCNRPIDHRSVARIREWGRTVSLGLGGARLSIDGAVNAWHRFLRPFRFQRTLLRLSCDTPEIDRRAFHQATAATGFERVDDPGRSDGSTAWVGVVDAHGREDRLGSIRVGPDGVEPPAFANVDRLPAALALHTSGWLPAWCAAVLLRLLPVEVRHVDFARTVCHELGAAELPCELDDSDARLGARVRQACEDRVPFVAIAGDREVDAVAADTPVAEWPVAMRRHDGKDMGVLPVAQAIGLLRQGTSMPTVAGG